MFLIFLFALNLALFFPSLNAYFFLDDADWLVHARNLNTNFHVLLEPEGGRLRPLLLLFYNMQYNLFGLDARFYHACSIFVHFLNACLVYHLAKTFSSHLRLPQLSARFFPSFASILFSVLFAHYQPVVWINFISESLCAFFVLLSLIFFLNIFDSRIPFKRIVLLTFSLAFYALALFTKESAYGYPFVIVIASFLIILKEKISPLYLIPYFALPALHFALTGNFGYLSFKQEQNLTSAVPALGLHFIPITSDSLTDLLLTLPSIVRIPGFTGLASTQFGVLYRLVLFTQHILTGIFFILLILFFAHLKNQLKSGKFRLIKQTFLHSIMQRKTMLSAETSFVFFCALSLFFFFLPNSFFFYLFTQTGASLARYRYLYLPSTTLCLLTGFFFAKALHRENKMKNAFVCVLFFLICASNTMNTYVMEKYHVLQGMKTKSYVVMLKSLSPPLKNNDTLLMLNFPQDESVLVSFHLQSYSELFLNKKILVVWATNENYKNKIKGKKYVHIINFNKKGYTP